MTQLEALIKGYEIGIEKNPVSGGIELAKIAANIKVDEVGKVNQCDSCEHGELTCTATGDNKGYPSYATLYTGMSFKVTNCSRFQPK